MSPSVGPDDARPGALPAAILLGFRPLRRVGIEGSEIVCRDRDNLRLCTCITLAFWTYLFWIHCSRSQGQGSHTTSKFDLRRASSGLNLNPPEVESKEKVCWIFDILQICRNHGHSVENIMNRHHLIEMFGAVRFGWRLPLLLSFIALALAGREMSIGSVLIFRPQLQSASDSTQLHQIAHLGTACGRLL